MRSTTLSSGIPVSRDNTTVFPFPHNPFVSCRYDRFTSIVPEAEGMVSIFSAGKERKEWYTLKIICWALRENGEVAALVPWMSQILACDAIDDPQLGRFEGFYDPVSGQYFGGAPLPKLAELSTAQLFHGGRRSWYGDSVQGIPDRAGTYVLLNAAEYRSPVIAEVSMWRLSPDGRIRATFENEEAIDLPIPPDRDGQSADGVPRVHCFLQQELVDQLKAGSADAQLAVSVIIDKASRTDGFLAASVDWPYSVKDRELMVPEAGLEPARF